MRMQSTGTFSKKKKNLPRQLYKSRWNSRGADSACKIVCGLQKFALLLAYVLWYHDYFYYHFYYYYDYVSVNRVLECDAWSTVKTPRAWVAKKKNHALHKVQLLRILFIFNFVCLSRTNFIFKNFFSRPATSYEKKECGMWLLLK